MQERADQGPCALAMALRGYERFILDLALMEQPDLMHRVLAYCVRVQTRFAMAILAPGGKFILGAGYGMGYDTPLQNAHALVEAARTYGVYRPDGSLMKG